MERGEGWKHVTFSDEKNLTLTNPMVTVIIGMASDEKPYTVLESYWRRVVMVWACFSFSGKSKIAFISRSINSEVYINLLE